MHPHWTIWATNEFQPNRNGLTLIIYHVLALLQKLARKAKDTNGRTSDYLFKSPFKPK